MYIHGKGQVIRHSGVGGPHHNGVVENTIKNVVRIAKTMTIHAVLRWNDTNKMRLWSVAIAHVFHLHNHNPQIYIGMSPKESWTRYNSSNSSIHNSHP